MHHCQIANQLKVQSETNQQPKCISWFHSLLHGFHKSSNNHSPSQKHHYPVELNVVQKSFILNYRLLLLLRKSMNHQRTFPGMTGFRIPFSTRGCCYFQHKGALQWRERCMHDRQRTAVVTSFTRVRRNAPLFTPIHIYIPTYTEGIEFNLIFRTSANRSLWDSFLFIRVFPRMDTTNGKMQGYVSPEM